MENQERLLTAIKLGTPDMVPYCDYFNSASIVNICRTLYGDDQIASGQIDVDFGTDQFEVSALLIRMTRDLDIDALFAYGMPGLREVPGDDKLIQDAFGNTYRKTALEPIPVEGAVKNQHDLKKISTIRPQDEDFRLLEYFKQNAPERALIYNVADAFKLSWRFLGAMEKLMPLYINDPGFIRKLARVATDFLKVEIEMAIEKGADVIVQDGDWAETKKPLLSPKMFREFIKPFCSEMTDTAHRFGVPIIKHSDGNVAALLDDIVEAGYDGFHPVEPQAMDMVEVKERLKGKICVMGNIDCMYLLPFGKPEEVVEAVKETLKIAAPGGGYICSSSNSVHPGVRAENAIAMIRAVRKYGKYPIQVG